MGNPVIQNIAFDMGGVLFENGTTKVISLLVNEYSISKDVAHDIYCGPNSWKLRAGFITSNDYWDCVKLH